MLAAYDARLNLLRKKNQPLLGDGSSTCPESCLLKLYYVGNQGSCDIQHQVMMAVMFSGRRCCQCAITVTSSYDGSYVQWEEVLSMCYNSDFKLRWQLCSVGGGAVNVL